MTTKNKNPHAVAMGRLGGKAKAAKLSPDQRSAIGRKVVQCRWSRRSHPVAQHQLTTSDAQQVALAPEEATGAQQPTDVQAYDYESLPVALDTDQAKLEQHHSDASNDIDPLADIWF